MTNLHLILYIAAFILLVLAAVGVPSGKGNFAWAAAACLVLTLIV